LLALAAIGADELADGYVKEKTPMNFYHHTSDCRYTGARSDGEYVVGGKKIIPN